MAQLVSTWSKDSSTKVGSVIVDQNNRIVSTGFNGYPSGIPDGDEDRQLKLKKTIHSEQNAIIFAKTDVMGMRLYCTHFPCSNCAAAIIQSKISCVIFKKPTNMGYSERWNESIKVSIDMFNQAGITVREI